MKNINFIKDIINIILAGFTICVAQTTVSLQQGLNGYTGCYDAVLQINNGGFGNWDFLTFEECPS